LLALCSVAQQSTGVLWERTLGGDQWDVGRKLAFTPDGGMVVAGTSNSVSATTSAVLGGTDVWVVRLDAYGVPLWHRNFGGSGDELAVHVEVLDDGRIVVLGSTSSLNGDLGVPLANADHFLLTLDPNGDPLFAQRFSAGPTGTTDIAQWVRLPDGTYAGVGGKLVYPTAGPVNADVMALRISPTGTVLWVQTYGGTGYDSGISIAASGNGKLTAVGITRSNKGDVTDYMGMGDGWLLEISPNGDLVSQRTLGGAFSDQLTGVVQTSDGHVVVTGYYSYEMMVFGTIQPATRVIIEKLAPNGQSVWRRDYGGAMGDYGWWIRRTPDGGFLLFAHAYSTDGDVTGFGGTIDAWLLRLDEQGELLWQRTFGGWEQESPGDIQLTADGGCVLLMAVSGPNSEMSQYFGDVDSWVVRLGPDGTTGTVALASPRAALDVTPALGGYTVHIAPEMGTAQLVVRDVAGRLLHSSTVPPGRHTLPLAANAGVYLISLQAGGRSTTTRIAHQ